MADTVTEVRQLADEIAVEEWPERAYTQAVVLAALRDSANKLEQLRERVAAGPYCYACGRISLYATGEAREELQATGLDVCSPRACPAWAVHAVYDHDRREWLTAGKCRVCGCTDLHACEPPCSWADDDHTLCSACAEGTDTDG